MNSDAREAAVAASMLPRYSPTDENNSPGAGIVGARGAARIVEAYLQIQFAILCDQAGFESWQLRCLEELLAVANVRAALLIDAAPLGGRPLPDIAASLPAIRLRDIALPDGAAGGAGTRRASGVAGASGMTGAAGAAAERCRCLDLDFILSFAAGPCPPELLEVARYGVWAYQFGDWTHHRGAPIGFWEVYDAEPVTAALLVRVQHAADAVVVLREGYLRTNVLSSEGNREQLLAHITRWPAQVCIDIGNGVTGRLSSRPLESTAPIRAAPTRTQRLRLRCRIAARAMRVVLRSLFRHDQWNVGRVDRPIASFLHTEYPGSVRWLAASSRSEFKADPFGVWRDGRLIIFYERFSYRDTLGSIAAVDSEELSPHAAVRIGPRPEVHLSYPYLIESNGRLLCMPESHEAAEIGLYEPGRFPDRWIKVANLLEGVPVVDATLFSHEGIWWLAGSEPAAKGTTCELHLWYARSIGGPWRPHPGNPVKIDVRSARPGGTPFYENGELYRPAQDCSRTYGGRVIINRIMKLTPTEFHETPVATVSPDPGGPYAAGLHTLSRAGDVTLIDGKRLVFSPPEFRRVLMHFLRSAWGRVRR